MLGHRPQRNSTPRDGSHHCGDMSLSSLCSQLAYFSERNPAPRALPLFSSQGPVRLEDQWAYASCAPACLTLSTESFHLFSSSTKTSIPLRLWAIWSHSVEAMTARCTNVCHWRLQMRRSCWARITPPPPCSLHSPANPAQPWMPIFSASCLMLWRSWVWNGLLQWNRPVATWMNGSCQGAARPLINKLRPCS